MAAEKIIDFIEEGRSLWVVQFSVIVIIAAIVIGSGFLEPRTETTRIYTREQVKTYHVKKVSHIPEKIADREAEKISADDNQLTEAEIRERYISYVISKIESNKIYPAAEQRKGHEGQVIFKVFIDRNGGIDRVQVTRQARFINLTRAAVAAIKKSLPFEPFSPSLKDEFLVIDLEIDFSIK